MRVDNLVEKDQVQLSLFDNKENKKQEQLDKVVDELKEKYGYNSITRAGKMNINKSIKLKDI
jgi:DNA polymerase-4